MPLGPPPSLPFWATSGASSISPTLPGLPQPLVGLNPHPFRHCYLHRRLGRLNASPRADGTPWQHSSLRGPRQQMPNRVAVLLSSGTSSLQPASGPSSATPERRARRPFSATVVTTQPLATPEHPGSCSFLADSIAA